MPPDALEHWQREPQPHRQLCAGSMARRSLSEYQFVRRDEGSGEILSGGNRYVHCERRFSIAVFEAAVRTVGRDWGVEPIPTVVCGQSEFASPHIPHETNPQGVGGGVKDLQWLVMDYR